MSKTIQINEIFGPTIQGEGPMTGRPTMFVRTFGCESRCVMCDTMYSVDPKHPNAKKVPMTVDEIIERLNELDPTKRVPVTLSGGNPALWELGRLVSKLQHSEGSQRKVWVETQGTTYKDWLSDVNCLVISPKGPGMKDEREGILKPERLCIFIGKIAQKLAAEGYERETSIVDQVFLKVVVFGPDDLDYAEQLTEALPGFRMYLSVGNSVPDGSIVDLPLTEHRQRLLSAYARLVSHVRGRPALHGAWVLPQLHVLLWGNETGV